MPATVVTMFVAALLGSLAYWQFGPSGAWVVLAFASSIVASVWGTTWGATALAKKHPHLATLLASSGVRMAAPLALALVIVVANGRLGPVETVYYVVPLYLCMLISDVAVWIREKHRPGEAR